MPPSCCRGYPVPLEDVKDVFDMGFKKEWNNKFKEFTTKRSVYCVSPGCLGLIPPWRIYSEQVLKPPNMVSTFAICKDCRTEHKCTMQCSCKDRFQIGHSCALSAMTVAEKLDELIRHNRSLTADFNNLEEILKEKVEEKFEQRILDRLRDAGLFQMCLEYSVKCSETIMARTLGRLEGVTFTDSFFLSEEERHLGESLKRDILQELHSFNHHDWVVRAFRKSLRILSKQIAVGNLEELEEGRGPERRENSYKTYF